MKKYEVLYKKIKSDLTDGSICYGEKLPSKRVAAETFGVSVVTVETAYEILESEGYIEARDRSGFYSIYRHGGIITAAEPVKDVILPTKTPSESFFPFSVYASAVRSVLNDYGNVLTDKSDGSGLKELKHAICSYLKTSRNVIVGEDRIIIGAGAEYLYGTIAELIGKNAIFALENPSYEQIEKVYAANGVKTERLNLGNDGILTEELRKSKATVLHVTPYRSFPTGVTASASKKSEYLRWVTERDGFLIEDDYESEFSLNARLTETLFGSCLNDKVVYVNSFSKTIFPSIRTAYAILPEKLGTKYYETSGFRSCPVPTLEQYVLAKLINDGSFVRHLNRIRRARQRSLEKQNNPLR